MNCKDNPYSKTTTINYININCHYRNRKGNVDICTWHRVEWGINLQLCGVHGDVLGNAVQFETGAVDYCALTGAAIWALAVNQTYPRPLCTVLLRPWNKITSLIPDAVFLIKNLKCDQT